jgi:hypothetical protein
MSDASSNGDARKRLLCPSAQPEMEDSMVLGVLEDTPAGRRLAWLEKPQTATTELLSLTHETDPRNIFRFAARCEEQRCGRCAAALQHPTRLSLVSAGRQSGLSALPRSRHAPREPDG